jgi:hypothetical protein
MCASGRHDYQPPLIKRAMWATRTISAVPLSQPPPPGPSVTVH